MLLKTHSFVKARCRKLPAAFAPGIGRLPSTRVVAHPMPPGLTYLSHQLRFREKLLRASSRDDMAGNQNNENGRNLIFLCPSWRGGARWRASGLLGGLPALGQGRCTGLRRPLVRAG